VPDSKFSSYTEEEFNLALGLWKKKKSPEVLVFFKNVDRAYLADPGPELTKVLSFRKKLENGRAILIRIFNNEVEFGQEIDRHLRAFAHGEWDALRAELPGIKLSRFQVAALSKAERAGKKRIEQVQKRQTKGQTRSKEVVATAKADLSLVKLVPVHKRQVIEIVCGIVCF
jgi:paraquat-inducible protein B